jgi:ubiquinone/menaquinone biosynthesis C-methylase UbiE/DNA-binding HxlR family transcriptional regulator
LNDDDARDPASALMRRLSGKWVVQALATAAELRLAEALDEPRTLDELARSLSCNRDALSRLLRLLVSEGALVEGIDSRYSLTPMGAQLRNDALGTLARFVGSPSQWVPWTGLTHTVRTGENAFEWMHGQSLFDYLVHHPEEAALYDQAVDAFTTAQAIALSQQDLLDDVQTVVDVGGGRGTLLLELLRRRPGLAGVLFERASVLARARERFEVEGLEPRCSFVEGDFFSSVPEGADVYVLKHVLHNWDDEQAETILRRCAEAAAPGGRIFVVEALLLPGNVRDGARLIDLEMLVLTGGGRERSKPEFRRLLAAANLRLVETRVLVEGTWLLVAQRR